jgi:DNA-binding NarL/FixJ family response regulator
VVAPKPIVQGRLGTVAKVRALFLEHEKGIPPEAGASALPDVETPLTEREKQLLRRLAEGKTDDQIASEIGGKASQIGVQRERLLQRLSICSDEAIRAAAKSLARWPYRQKR